MTIVSIKEAKNRLTALARLVEKGETVVVTRNGKPVFELGEFPDLLQRMGFAMLAINERHVLAVAQPKPRTRDPFDRLLLAQCMVENFRLVTIDRVLKHHQITWQPS